MDSPPVRIYSCRDVPRLRYIASLLLGDILGLNWELVTDKRKLRKHVVINYSDEDIKGSYRIIPDELLFEKGISPREITVSAWNGIPVFFSSPGESDFPFDIFAASFFLVSRYEEYLDHTADEHGRFKASSSLAFRNGFLGIPIIDIWAKELAKSLVKRFRTITFRRNEFRSILTIDTDEMSSDSGRNIFRSIGALVTDIAGHSATKQKIAVSQDEKDHSDVYDYIFECIENNGQEARFFFPVGDRSRHDLNPSWKNSEYRKVMTGVAEKYDTGLHPSYSACVDSSLTISETGRLKTILGKDITSSRFHYLRIQMPQSYRNILDAGISEDYSMGYPDEPGFRAGISGPFMFYDLAEDRETKLKIYPFQVMDVTLFRYKNLGPEDSKSIILDLVKKTRKAGGTFVSIWHNTSLCNDERWKGWRDLFEFTIKNQSDDSLL